MNDEDRERLVRIETKLDHVIEGGNDRELRIRSLEKKVWAFPGLAILALVGAKLGLPITHA